MTRNIIIIILILAFIGVVVFLDLPEVQSVLKLRKDIEQEKKVFLDKQDLLARIEKLTKLYEENEESIKKVDYILPPDKNTPELIVQFEALAFENGLILEGIEFPLSQEKTVSKAKEVRSGGKAISKNYRTLAINLKLIGNYPAFKSFLKGVEENMRLMDINSIDFSSEGEKSSGLFKFDVNLSAYYQ